MAYLVELWNSIHTLSAARPWLAGVIVLSVMIVEGLFLALALEGAVKIFTSSARRSKRHT